MTDEFTGTEKQVKYAQNLRAKVFASIDKAIWEIEYYYGIEVGELGEDPLEASRCAFDMDWADRSINLSSAFRMFRKGELTSSELKNPEFPLQFLRLAKTWGDTHSSAAWWIENAGVGRATVFLAHFTKTLKLNKES